MSLRVACLGAGYFARFHHEAWARIARANLVGVADSDIARATASGQPAFQTLDAMLTATSPDILDIIVPPAAHLDAIRTALGAGPKAIICQKPFCTSLAEATQAAGLAAAANIPLIIHENFRFQPWYRLIHAQITAGRLGRVQQASFRLRPGDGQGPRAYLDRQPYFQTMPRLLVHETGVHWIDTFRFLLGPITAVYADLCHLNPAITGEDAGIVLLDHASGARSLFDGNRHLDHAAKNLRHTMGEALVEGPKGSLTLTGDGAVNFRAFGANHAQTLLAAGPTEGFGGDCVHALQSHVVAGLLDGAPLENTAQDYLTVLGIEQAIYRSAREGRKITL
ncbi:MAG: Gfo/Idh/MocA family oxidoreductase [Paracoccaceae bacterium]